MTVKATSATSRHDETLIEAFANEFLGILRNHQLQRCSGTCITELSLDESYAVQKQVLAARIQAGEQTAGWKIGCTSPSIQRQFGLTQPISGRLLQPNIFADADVVPSYPECAVEAELVFRMGRDLTCDMDDEELTAAIAAVYPGIELHQYRFWYGEPTSQELICSNGIHAGLVVGTAHDPRSIDLDTELMELYVGDKLEAEGAGAEVMGGPLHSLRWLARHVAERGQQVRSGELVIPGSAVRLVRVVLGDRVEARFANLGSCSCRLG